MKILYLFFIILNLCSNLTYANSTEESEVYTRSINILAEVARSQELQNLLIEKKAIWKSIEAGGSFLMSGESAIQRYRMKVEGPSLPRKGCLSTYIYLNYDIGIECDVGDDG